MSVIQQTMTPGTRSGSSLFYRRPGRAVLIAFAGVLAVSLVVLFVRVPAQPSWLGSSIMMAAVAAPMVVAAVLARAKAGVPDSAEPVLLVWRWSDVGLGVSVALFVRAVVELIFPTTASLFGGFAPLAVLDVLVLVVGAAIITPIVEEIFFRGVLLGALADALGELGRVLGGVIAIAISTLVFVFIHALSLGAATTMATLLGPLLIGVATGILLLTTRRLTSAIVAHVVFNTIGVGLLIV